jgi:tetratricopeptide (TPR) repeat protein
MPRLYQQLLAGVVSYEALGRHILTQIEAAQAFRQVERVRELAGILINIPIKEYQLVAQYYLVWCKCRENYFPIELLENIIDRTSIFKVKALSCRGTVEWYKGNNEVAMYFYNEALKASPTVSEYIDLSKAIAVLKSQEGFHKSAIRDLEKLLPITRHAEPLIYTLFLNTYAIELSLAGRLDEAENASVIAASSPFGPYYPEVQETLFDIRSTRKRPRYIQIKANPVQEISDQETALEIYEPDIEPDTNLLMFRGRKPLYSQEPHYSPVDAAGDQFTAQQKRSITVDIVCNLDDADLGRLFAFAIEIDDQPIRSRRPRRIDLESKSTLEDLMCLWANNDLDPNDYVAVLSALRDCKDSLRRQNIIDEMITHIYRFTQERMQGESMWRKRVEAKLVTEDD